jgi:hypothetical protein
MRDLRCTLLSDGSSDRVLVPILDWALRQRGITYAIQHAWADLRYIREAARADLATRIALAVHVYPCDLLFIHRDAEKMARDVRVAEIAQAMQRAGSTLPQAICVIPVRMQEAWLLLNEQAIRLAAGNCHGTMPLSMPRIEQLETLPDPKAVLYQALRDASGRSGRRRRHFRPEAHAGLVTEYMSDFTCLRQLPAFRAFEDDLAVVVNEKGWSHA